MAIIYDPKKLAQEIAPEKKIDRMLSKRVTLKRAALSFLNDASFIDKKKVTDVALKTVRGYQEREARAQAEAGQRSAGKEVRDEILDDPKQLIQRVQNEVIFQIKEEIKYQYKGERYEWLPSDASEPDPEHQLNYGKIFKVGEGEMPGDRYGCRCGMRILVDEEELKLV